MNKVTPKVFLILIFGVFYCGQKQDAGQQLAGKSLKNSENKTNRISENSVLQKSVPENGSGGCLPGGIKNSVGQTQEVAVRTIGRSNAKIQISRSANAAKAVRL